MQVSGNNALMNAYQGIQTGFQHITENSQKISNPNSPNKAEPLIKNQLSEQQVLASTNAVKSANERVGTLLDIMA